MKPFLISSLLLALSMAFPLAPVSAATAVKKPGLKPGDALYFLDTVFENVNLAFTFKPENKVKKALGYAAERLAEVAALTEEKDTAILNVAVDDYKDKIELAMENVKEIEEKEAQRDSLSLIIEDTSKQQEILSEIIVKIPEEARKVITTAIAVNTESRNEAIKQVEALFQKLHELQSTALQQKPDAPFCYEFNRNLIFGETGTAVSFLHKALESEGFTIPEEEKASMTFGQGTALAVAGFQEKYREDILVPLGLDNGLGDVGELTRKKLTVLYGCGAVSEPIIELLSPFSGSIRALVVIHGFNFTDNNDIGFVSSINTGGPFEGERHFSGLPSENGKILKFRIPETLLGNTGERGGDIIEMNVVPGKYYVVVQNIYGKSLPVYFTIKNSN